MKRLQEVAVTYRQFDVEDRAELAAAGLEPQPLEGDEIGGVISWEGSGKQVELSYDIPGRSVRIKIFNDNRQLELDIFREGAVRLRSQWEGEKLCLQIIFEVDDLAGKIEVGLTPLIYMRDSMLFV
ncbi:hypothetical protein [Nonomuraea basaltis]|uniref:hypothetical protein n=1 Tax=Nonomuraea basaltis TaxID=2495887 RepID=UPI00110C6846|nr:hypothetical protein [Nonomuraea basaltis]TMR99782.1 hypothetical protein EJK15_05810 [Nonomuraea basaltis]